MNSKDLQFGHAARPQHHEYTGVLFLGSTLQNVRERLSFLNSCLELDKIVTNKIYLLTGVRPLDKAAGETAESLLDPQGTIAVRPDLQPPTGPPPTDEGPMVEWVFQQSRSDAIQQDQVVLIYAGVGEGRNRATTKTTVQEWLKTNPQDGLYLVVSHQPFNLYQKLVIERTLQESERRNIRLEVIGGTETKPRDGFDLNKQVAYALDNIARICYELTQQSR